jgi:hypothetical protein
MKRRRVTSCGMADPLEAWHRPRSLGDIPPEKDLSLLYCPRNSKSNTSTLQDRLKTLYPFEKLRCYFTITRLGREEIFIQNYSFLCEYQQLC